MMKFKVIFTLSVLILSTLFATAQSKVWLSWEEALVQTQRHPKPFCIKVVQPDCHYCSDMQAAVFNQPEVKKFLSQNFTLVQIDLSKDELPMGFDVSMTPTFFFLDSDKKLIKKIPGAWKKEEFLDMVKEVLQWGAL